MFFSTFFTQLGFAGAAARHLYNQIIMNLRDDGMTFRWSVSSSGPERRLQARMRVRSECRIAKPPINGPRATGGQPLR